VLRRKDIGEADRILTLFTPGMGKVRVIAKGIRKPRSRKAGHLELFTRANLLLATGRDLDIVTQAETLEAYRPLREDLLSGAYGAYMVELLDRFTPDAEEHAALYDLLRRGLSWVCEARSQPAEGGGPGAGQAQALALAARYYELHLLSMAGYQPQLRVCVACGRDLQPVDQFFSAAEGGVVCTACGQSRGELHAGRLPLSLGALKLLRYMQSNPWSRVAALNIGSRTHAEVEYLAVRYITLLLERQLKSVEFLRLIRRAELAPA
jgi:DNA repair protein RecO (recombination protein O)